MKRNDPAGTVVNNAAAQAGLGNEAQAAVTAAAKSAVSTIAAEVRDYILANFLPGDPVDSLRDDDLLLEGGIVDSGSVMSLVLHLEDRFGIRVEDDDLVVENFATVERIAMFVAAKNGASGSCVCF